MSRAAPLLSHPLFTAKVGYNGMTTYDFGFIDHSAYKGELSTIPRLGAMGLWDFEIDGFKMGDGPMVDTKLYSIADTGVSQLLAPASIVHTYYANMKNSTRDKTSGLIAFPCSEFSNLPDLHVSIKGTVLTMPKHLGNAGEVHEPPGYCLGALQVGFGDTVILGSAFLRSQFVVFNYNQGGTTATLQFAQQA